MKDFLQNFCAGDQAPANLILSAFIGIIILRTLVMGAFKAAWLLVMMVAIAWLIYSNSQFQ